MDYPFNDENMQYDYRAHRYVLTENDVFETLGENLSERLNQDGDANPSTLPQRFLKRVSNVVYNYIYENSWNRAYLEYVLACVPGLRNMVKEMLEAQTVYMLINGDIAQLSGVNVDRGQIMDIEKLRGRAKVADEVEQLANEIVPELGFSLKYIGPLPDLPSELYRRGY